MVKRRGVGDRKVGPRDVSRGQAGHEFEHAIQFVPDPLLTCQFLADVSQGLTQGWWKNTGLIGHRTMIWRSLVAVNVTRARHVA